MNTTYSHLHGQSTGENPIHSLPRIADFRLKCCILKEDTKNNISGSYQRREHTPEGKSKLLIACRF